MERNMLLKILLASLLHDIGKVYERAKIELEKNYQQINQDLYQPFKKGHYTHKHVLYTLKFLEKFKDYIPKNLLEFTSDGDSLINLSSKHHKPDSPEQWIIAEADRLSSGIERRKYEWSEKIQNIPSEIPMLSVFEDVSLEGQWREHRPENFNYVYELAPLSPYSIFPRKKHEIIINKKKYQELILGFEEGFKNLPAKKYPHLWLENLNTLLLQYFLFVPSATSSFVEGKFISIPSDISLYDHLYFTSSLAVALYLYHKETSTFNEQEIKKKDTDKFLFIEGNFYGIQNFIFSTGGSTRKYAAKILRGRSFYVSLLSELSADLILQRIGLPFVSVLFNTAGKFLILAPNLNKILTILKKVEEEINDWLYENFYGEVSIGIITAKAKPEELYNPEGYRNLKQRLGRDSENKKYEKFDLYKYGGEIKSYFEKFGKGLRVCDLCGKRPGQISLEEEDLEICEICLDHKTLGEKLVKNNYLIVSSKEEKNSTLKECFFNFYRISLTDKPNISNLDRVFHKWDISLIPQKKKEKYKEVWAVKFINNYVPKDKNGIPISFEELSECSLTTGPDGKLGISALGVFKADVDNLGTIFIQGFRKEKRTFSRYLALSRQLNLFFSYYLPFLCTEKFQKIYNVFAGGDDLFVVGPWNEVIEFAKKVREEFKKYTCYNKSFTLSGGYILIKPELPVIEMAKKAEEALDLAKKSKDGKKDKISIFKIPLFWDLFFELEETKEKLLEYYQNNRFSRVYLYRLNELIELSGKAREVLESFCNGKKGKLKGESLKALLWPSKLYYFTVRNFSKQGFLNKKEWQKQLEEFLLFIKTSLEKYGEGFKVPLWQIIYQTRRAGHDRN